MCEHRHQGKPQRATPGPVVCEASLSKYYDSCSTHAGPSLSPVPGPTASGPDLTVLVAGGASLHLHVAPGEGGDLWRGHVM